MNDWLSGDPLPSVAPPPRRGSECSGEMGAEDADGARGEGDDDAAEGGLPTNIDLDIEGVVELSTRRPPSGGPPIVVGGGGAVAVVGVVTADEEAGEDGAAVIGDCGTEEDEEAVCLIGLGME